MRAAPRCAQEQLAAHGLKVPLSEGCLTDFVRNATEAVGEPYIACLCRHLDARVRFILLWITSEESFERPVWAELIAMGHKHALARPERPAPEPVPQLNPAENPPMNYVTERVV